MKVVTDDFTKTVVETNASMKIQVEGMNMISQDATKLALEAKQLSRIGKGFYF